MLNDVTDLEVGMVCWSNYSWAENTSTSVSNQVSEGTPLIREFSKITAIDTGTNKITVDKFRLGKDNIDGIYKNDNTILNSASIPDTDLDIYFRYPDQIFGALEYLTISYITKN